MARQRVSEDGEIRREGYQELGSSGYGNVGKGL
jgi:hypothetical protein